MSAAHAMKQASEADLVRRSQTGDRQALAALTGRYWTSIRRQAFLELYDRSLADDACQEALMRVVRHIGTCDPERPFGAWLHGVVRNACHDVRNAHRKLGHAHIGDQPVPERASPTRPDRQLDLDRAAKRALAAFGTLAPRQRQVFDLCDRRGFTPTEAAARLGIAPGTVRATLFQARRALRQQLLDASPDLMDVLREAR